MYADTFSSYVDVVNIHFYTVRNELLPSKHRSLHSLVLV